MDSLFPSFIPATFPVLALAHFLALLSPGPDFFLIVGHAVRRRLRGSLFICIGIAAGNAIYIVLAVAGWSSLKNYPRLYTVLELAGSIYLCWLGYMLIRSGRQGSTLDIKEMQELSRLKQLVTGLASALLNPKNAIFYLTLMTVITGNSATLPQQLFAGVWMTFLVLAWDVSIACLISHQKAQKILQKRIHHVELAAGAILVAFAAAIMLRLLI